MHAAKIPASIVTNGLCLTKTNLKFLAQNNIKTVGISIDGGTAKTHDYIRQVPGLWKKIFRNVKNNPTDVQFTAITTLNKLNFKEFPLMLKKFSDADFTVWEVQTASPHGRMRKEMTLSPLEFYFSAIFLVQARKRVPPDKLAIIGNHDFGYYSEFLPRHTLFEKWCGCPAGKTALGIKSNGNLIGCLSLDGGKFREVSLLEIPLKKALAAKDFCKWNNPKKLSGFCKSCKHGAQCQAGCSDFAEALTGDIGCNPHCYYAIETHYKNKKDKTDFDKLFVSMINGKILDNGDIALDTGEILTRKLLKKYDLTPQEKELFKCLFLG
jgi:radical SAM protein with 4Fe4S-binding SPASM domain